MEKANLRADGSSLAGSSSSGPERRRALLLLDLVIRAGGASDPVQAGVALLALRTAASRELFTPLRARG